MSAVVTAHNEGEQVRATLESLAASVDAVDLEIVLVDDASGDGSCNDRANWDLGGAELVYVRHDRPLGVGRARNAGLAAASGRVVSFHDAHMRFPARSLDALAAKALLSGAIVSSASAGLDDTEPQWWGCDLFWNRRDGLQPKWRVHRPAAEWEPVPCPMGAGYVLSRDTVETLWRPSGRLWEDTAGRWGFSEQALAVKAFLLGVPVCVSRDHHVGHLYRSSNPVPDAARHVWRNVCRATALLLPPATFRERFLPWCRRRLPADEVRRLSHGLEPVPPAAWARDPEEIFTHLCGREAVPGRRHRDHAWLDEVEAACRRLAERHPGGQGVRVACRRPGEALLCVRKLLPAADIEAWEWSGHRLENWNELCCALDVGLHRIRPGDAGFPNGNRPGGGYTLILLNDEFHEACAPAARALADRDGVMLVNESADAGQIEHAERDRELATLSRCRRATQITQEERNPA